ncbi:hypothetical protein DFH06DRAFT_1427709 [Mycena polygramma]|nr:hypothetical protein DFH06DRAFT_1427709 [Mycena polygramma]
MDSVMNEVMPYWPQQHIPNYSIHPKLVQYLNGRQWNPAVRKSISCMWVMDQLWEAFAQALAHDRRVLQMHSTAELLGALWRLLILGFHAPPSVLQRIVDSVLPVEVQTIGPFVLAVLKSQYVRTSDTELRQSDSSSLISPVYAAAPQPGASDGGPNAVRLRRRADAEFALFVEFLECCAGSDLLPHEPAATLRCIDPSTEPWSIPAPQQTRFANAIRDVFLNPRCTADV